MSLSFDEQILEAAKSIAAATAALVKSASAAQRELVAQGKVSWQNFLLFIIITIFLHILQLNFICICNMLFEFRRVFLICGYWKMTGVLLNPNGINSDWSGYVYNLVLVYTPECGLKVHFIQEYQFKADPSLKIRWIFVLSLIWLVIILELCVKVFRTLLLIVKPCVNTV